MQTINSYVYDNTVLVQLDEDPLIKQRNRVVYTRPIQIYKGINNIIKIAVQNADQKPVNITGYVLTFNVVDDYVYSNATTVLTTNICVSNANAGIGYTVISSDDLVQLTREQYTYNVMLRDTCWGNIATYVDDNYGAPLDLMILAGYYANYAPAPEFTYDVIDGGSL